MTTKSRSWVRGWTLRTNASLPSASVYASVYLVCPHSSILVNLRHLYSLSTRYMPTMVFYTNGATESEVPLPPNGISSVIDGTVHAMFGSLPPLPPPVAGKSFLASLLLFSSLTSYCMCMCVCLSPPLSPPVVCVSVCASLLACPAVAPEVFVPEAPFVFISPIPATHTVCSRCLSSPLSLPLFIVLSRIRVCEFVCL